MNTIRTIAFALLLATSGVALTACKQEGLAEKAGKKVDKGMDKAGDAMKDAGDAITDTAKDAKDAVKDATK